MPAAQRRLVLFAEISEIFQVLDDRSGSNCVVVTSFKRVCSSSTSRRYRRILRRRLGAKGRHSI